MVVSIRTISSNTLRKDASFPSRGQINRPCQLQFCRNKTSNMKVGSRCADGFAMGLPLSVSMAVSRRRIIFEILLNSISCARMPPSAEPHSPPSGFRSRRIRNVFAPMGLMRVSRIGFPPLYRIRFHFTDVTMFSLCFHPFEKKFLHSPSMEAVP